MSLKKSFIDSSNIVMMWDIISETLFIKKQNKLLMNTISEEFISQSVSFFQHEIQKNSFITLIELNKKYLYYFVEYVQNKYSNSNISCKKITIHEEKEQINMEDVDCFLNTRQYQYDKFYDDNNNNNNNNNDHYNDNDYNNTELIKKNVHFSEFIDEIQSTTNEIQSINDTNLQNEIHQLKLKIIQLENNISQIINYLSQQNTKPF